MLRDEAISMILNRLQRGTVVGAVDTALQAALIPEIKFVQNELETGEKANLPWFLETEYENAAFKTTAGTATLAWPATFLRELDEEKVTLFYQDTTLDDQWVPIAKVDYDEGKTQLGGETPGKPQAYTVLGKSYRFWPVPDAEYPLRALVYVADTVLDTNIENNWLKFASKLMIGRTGEIAAGSYVVNPAMQTIFADMAARGADALSRDNTARKESGRMRSMGEE